MKEIVEITYNGGHGHMTIVVAKFFPTSKVRIDKLKKVIDLDWEHSEQIWVDIRERLKELIPELEADKQKEAHTFHHYNEEVAWLKNRLKDKTSPQGVKLTKEQLEEYREKKKRFGEIARNAKSDFNRIQRQIEQVKQNLEYMADFE